jgi:hypothetical protein
MIEELTGRKVLGYQSQFLFEPEVVIEIFFFDRAADAAAATATGPRPAREARPSARPLRAPTRTTCRTAIAAD